MIRELIESAGNTYLLNLPEAMIGKTVEVIAFEIEKESFQTEIETSGASLKEINERYGKYRRISHADFQFDRDEANNYE